MALLFCDGFDWVDGNTEYAAKYTQRTAYLVYGFGSRTPGRFGVGRCASTPAVGGGYLDASFGGSRATVISGVAFYPGDTNGGSILGFLDGTGTQHVKINWTLDGRINAYRGGTWLGQSYTAVIRPWQWNYVEAKVTINNTTGSVVLRVNNEVVLTLTNVDTQNGGSATITRVNVGGLSTTDVDGNCYWDDFYICDTTGSYNNDFLGDICVATLFPSSDSSPLQWASTAGTSYTEVDETDWVNSDADYISSNTYGDVSMFGVQNLSGSMVVPASSIKAVVNNVSYAKTDLSPPNMIRVKQIIKSGGSQATLSAEPSGSTYYYRPTSYVSQLIAERDPNGSIAWTESSVNAIEVGVEAEKM